jgi:hypothetical protein
MAKSVDPANDQITTINWINHLRLLTVPARAGLLPTLQPV